MDEKAASVWIQLIQTVGRVSVWGIAFGFGYMGISELAGKSTAAIFDASLEYSTGINIALIMATLLSIFYGLGERRFREYKIRYLTQRIKELETEIDPRRSSSGLPSSGNTRPEDK